jgi:hypothetical protein
MWTGATVTLKNILYIDDLPLNRLYLFLGKTMLARAATPSL